MLDGLMCSHKVTKANILFCTSVVYGGTTKSDLTRH